MNLVYSFPSGKKNFSIVTKNYEETDIKFVWLCLISLDFFTFSNCKRFSLLSVKNLYPDPITLIDLTHILWLGIVIMPWIAYKSVKVYLLLLNIVTAILGKQQNVSFWFPEKLPLFIEKPSFLLNESGMILRMFWQSWLMILLVFPFFHKHIGNERNKEN